MIQTKVIKYNNKDQGLCQSVIFHLKDGRKILLIEIYSMSDN